jgi:hypothetical protein
MSKEGQKAILLTKDGTFQKVRLKKDARVTVGQTVLDSDIALRPAVAKKIPMALAACLTVIIVFSLISGFAKNNAIAAYVSFDVNPSIEAAINRDFRIVEVKGLNSEGAALLDSGIHYKDMPLEEFSLAIADQLSEKGYLENQPDIVVSTIVTDKVKATNREDFITKINEAVNKVKNNHIFEKNNGSLEVINTTMNRRKEAEKAGISTGKYLIYLKEEKGNGKGKQLKLSQVKHMTVKQLRHSHEQTQAQDTIEVDASQPKKYHDPNKKHGKKKDAFTNEGQLNDGELLKKNAEKATHTQKPSNGYKKGNPHWLPNDLFKQNNSNHNKEFSPFNDDEKMGPQKDKDNKGNNNKEWKHAG